MLRLWPDFSSQKIWLALSVDGIAIVRQSRGFNKRVLSQQYIQALDIHANRGNLALWQGLINQLDEYLSNTVLKKNTQVNVVLSSELVRYLMVPTQQIVMSDAEKITYTQALFTSVYGAAANDWHIKYHPAAPDQTTIGVAVDKALLTALNQLAAKYQLKLNSVQPYLMTALNGLSRPTARIIGHLALLENTKLLLVHLQKGSCQQIQVSPCNHDWQAVLHNMLNRELLMNEYLDEADKDLFIYAPTQKSASLQAFNGWKTKRIGLDLNQKLPPQFYMLDAVL